jgi:spore germination protein YaaH
MLKLLTSLFSTINLLFNPAFISPVSNAGYPVNQLTSQPINFIRYGFLPYWNLKFIDTIKFDQLTDLLYFAISLNADGTLNQQDVGYRRFIQNYDTLNQIAKQNHLQLGIVINNSNDQTLFDFLNNATAHTQFIHDLSLLTAHYSLSTINLDFEPLVATNSATINGLTNFVRSYQLTNQRVNQLTIDIYPSAASSQKLWDLPALSPNIDQFIVMTYDYYHPGSNTAGPISPLYLATPTDNHAVIKNIAQISRFISSSKIILGLPFYGYEWPTSQTSYLSSPNGKGSLASFSRIQSLLQSPPSNLKLQWDSLTLSPWLSYAENHQVYQIYYENPTSLTYKRQLISNANLGGFAIWALGYEGDNTSLWTSLK